MQGKLEHNKKLSKKIQDIVDDLPEYAKEWYFQYLLNNFTLNTIRDTLIKVRKYLLYIDDHSQNVTLDMITEQSLESFMSAIQTKNDKDGMIVMTSGSYQVSIWIALRGFITYLFDNGYINSNYMDNISRPISNDRKRIQQEWKPLTKDEFNKILVASKSNVHTQDAYCNRDLSIMYLLMTTGIKDSTLCELNIEDIDFKHKSITIKNQIIMLSDQTMESINLWMNDRKSDKTNALFVNKHGQRLSTFTITHLVGKYSEIALGYKVTPQQLRSSFCSILYYNTHDIELVRKVMGHKYVSTTKKYLHLKDEEIIFETKMIENILK